MTDSLEDRYSRQAAFPAIGHDGQGRIQKSSAVLIGVGALGTHLASHLVRAGIGKLTIIDRDIVEASNLQRQLLYDEADAHAANPKAIAAATRLREINKSVEIEALIEDFDLEVYESMPAKFDILLDGTDNFATRYLLNDLSVRDDSPWLYAGAVGSTARAMAIVPGRSPCLRCLVPDPPAAAELGTCETAGALGPAIAMAAGFQAAQALRIMSGHEPVRGMFVADVWSGECGLRLKDHPPQEDCPSCGTKTYPSLQQPPHETLKLCGRDAVQIRPPRGKEIDLGKLAIELARIAPDLESSEQMLRFTVDGCRISVFRGGRALLFGVSEPQRARILYDRYIGST